MSHATARHHQGWEGHGLHRPWQGPSTLATSLTLQPQHVDSVPQVITVTRQLMPSQPVNSNQRQGPSLLEAPVCACIHIQVCVRANMNTRMWYSGRESNTECLSLWPSTLHVFWHMCMLYCVSTRVCFTLYVEGQVSLLMWVPACASERGNKGQPRGLYYGVQRETGFQWNTTLSTSDYALRAGTPKSYWPNSSHNTGVFLNCFPSLGDRISSQLGWL